MTNNIVADLNNALNNEHTFLPSNQRKRIIQLIKVKWNNLNLLAGEKYILQENTISVFLISKCHVYFNMLLAFFCNYLSNLISISE